MQSFELIMKSHKYHHQIFSTQNNNIVIWLLVNVSVPVVAAETAVVEVADDVIVSYVSPRLAVRQQQLWLMLHLHHIHWHQLH